MEDKYLIKELRQQIHKLHVKIKYLTEIIDGYGGIPDTTEERERRKTEKAENKRFATLQYKEAKKRKKLAKINKEDYKLPWEQRYNHPKWRIRSQEIKRRDNFKCTKCGSGDKLEVHHLIYQPGFEVWEYGGDYLITVCRTCHGEIHKETSGRELVNHGKPIERYIALQ